MRTIIGIATFLAVGAGTVGVGAVLSLRGSDTLKDLTLNLLTDNTAADGNPALDCGGVNQAATGTLAYEGTGSGNGQAAMIGGSATQHVAPMSGAPNTNICGTGTGTSGGSTTAEGIVFALDGMSIVASGTTAPVNCSGTKQLAATDCGNDAIGAVPTPAGLTFSGTLPTTGYVMGVGTGTDAGRITSASDAWKDALRLIFLGQDHNGAQDCTSAVRRELVNSYKKVFQNQTTAADSVCTVGNSCAQIRHAFRRNDESGTTDAFLKSITNLAISQPNSASPFCNVGTKGPTVVASPTIACGTAGETQAVANTQCNNGQASGGRCVLTAGSPNIHTCDRLPCVNNAGCPGSSPTCDTPLASSPTGNICTFEKITVARSDLAGHFSGFTADSATRLFPAPRPPSITVSSGNGVSTFGYKGGFVDMQDADPIRTACGFTAGSPTEDVCNRDNKLGLVLPIWDTSLTTPSAVAYPTQPCDTGVFTCVLADTFVVPGSGDLCPNGVDPSLTTGLCPQNQCPVAAKQVRDGSGNVIGQDPQCLSVERTSVPPEVSTTFGQGGLVSNLVVWSGTTVGGGVPTIVTETRATGQFGIPTTVLGSSRAVPMIGAFFRLHSRHGLAAGTLCNDVTVPSRSATDTISCLVNASPCSIGYAGNSAVKGNTVALNVNNTAPSDPCIQKLLDTTPVNQYKLSRKLYLNTVAGFEFLHGAVAGTDQANELKLAQCFADPTIAQERAKTNFDFVRLGTRPDTTARTPYCIDWAAATCGASATPGACSNNVDSIPTSTTP